MSVEVAAMDVAGYLPAPAPPGVCASDILAGQLLAYTAGSTILVVELDAMQLVAALHGEHADAALTAVAWQPLSSGAGRAGRARPRLASGDEAGRVVVWDVGAASALLGLEREATGEQQRTRGGGGRQPGAVRGLAWVGAEGRRGLDDPGGRAQGLLAVVTAPATVTLWDLKSGRAVWEQELSATELATGISVDPLDARQISLTGEKGAITVLKIRDPAAKDVATTGYRVDVTTDKKHRPVLRTRFSAARELLYVLLARELLVFDLEYGQPATSTRLPSGAPAFEDILALTGNGVSHGAGDAGGIDVLTALHQDGSLSAWTLNAMDFTYSCACLCPLLPPSGDTGNGSGSRLLSVVAAVRRPPPEPSATAAPRAAKAAGTVDLAASTAPDTPWAGIGIAALSLASPATPGPSSTASGATPLLPTPAMSPVRPAPGSGHRRSRSLAACGNHMLLDRSISMSRRRTNPPVPQLCVAGVTQAGRVCRWDFPLDLDRLKPCLLRAAVQSEADSFAANATPQCDASPSGTSFLGSENLASGRPRGYGTPEIPTDAFKPPRLKGMLQSLPARATVFAVCPAIVSTPQHGPSWPAADAPPPDSLALAAAGCANGSIELIAIHRGGVMAISMTVFASLLVHDSPVRSLHWLADTPRIVSCASCRGVTGWKNSVVVTDVLRRTSFQIRQYKEESAAIETLRVSSRGEYVVVLLRNSQTEVWHTAASGPCKRLKILDVAVHALEWVQPFPRTEPQEPVCWPLWGDPRTGHSHGGEPKAPSGPSSDVVSEELCLLRPNNVVIILEVAGAALHKRAALPLNVGVESGARPTSVAALRAGGASRNRAWILYVGFSDGVVHRFDSTDMRSHSATVATTAVLKIVPTGPAPSCLRDPARGATDPGATRAPATDGDSGGAPGSSGRVAVLCRGGAFGVWELDAGFALSRGSVAVGASRRAMGAAAVSWVPLPGNLGSGTVLSTLTDTGCIAIWDVSQTARQQPSIEARSLRLRQELGWPWPDPTGALCPGPPAYSLLLLPPPWAAALRLLMQLGMSPDVFAKLSEPPSVELDAVLCEALSRVLAGVVGDKAHPSASEPRSPTDNGPRSASMPPPATSISSRLGSMNDLVAGMWGDQEPPAAPPLPQSPSVNPPSARPFLRFKSQFSETNRSFVDRELASLPSTREEPSQLESPEASTADPSMRVSTCAHDDDLVSIRGTSFVCVSAYSSVFGPFSDSPLHIQGPDNPFMEEGPLPGAISPLGEEAPSADDPGQSQGATDMKRKSTLSVSGLLNAMRRPTRENAAEESSAAFSGRASQPLDAALSSSPPFRPSARAPSPLEHITRPAGAATPASPESAPPPKAGPKTSNLGELLQIIASMRGAPQALHPEEMRAYKAALAAGGTADRMACAAWVAGDAEEAAFWEHLPDTLEYLRRARGEVAHQPAVLAPTRGATDPPGSILDALAGRSPEAEACSSGGARLWDERLVLAEGASRAALHERMATRNPEAAAPLQESRLLEYVSLGDFETAVGLLLASAPAPTARYYRDALCTLALAAAASEGRCARGTASARGSSLHVQAAKVVAVHAAGVGDELLGVPLLCSVGLPREAVKLLMDQGMWRHAATLMAQALHVSERPVVVERWAAHVLEGQGALWRAVGLLTSAGCLKGAFEVLRSEGLPDAAAAYVAACREAGLGGEQEGGLDNCFSGATPPRSVGRSSTMPVPRHTGDLCTAANDVAKKGFVRYIADLMERL